MINPSIQKQNILKACRYIIFLLSAFVFLIGKVYFSLNITLVGTLILYIAGILFCFEQVRRRVVTLFFYVTLFVFLLSRPTISMFRGNVWWYYGIDGCHFALNVIYISLICIYFGSIFVDKILEAKGMYLNEHTGKFLDFNLTKNDKNNALRFISCVGYYVCLAFSLLQGVYTLIAMNGREYSEMYLETGVSLPFFVQALAVFMPYFLCVYLATLPPKYSAFLALGAYVLSTLPMLVLGARNNTVLAAIFAFVYFIIRDYLDGTKKWVGRFERIALVICIPLGLAFMAYYNYAREGQTVIKGGFFSLIVDFFYKQGVSFDVMCMAHGVMDKLPDVTPKCYTFGGIIDYLTHGMFARELFGAVSLGEGNNVIKAIYGNSFAHILAYLAEPNYLSGHGLGSSYILEGFADLGYAGVAFVSTALSTFMTCAICIFRKNTFWRIFILNCLTSFFLIPRAEATGWLNFIVYLQFWAVLFFCYFMADIFLKEIGRHKYIPSKKEL